MSPDRNLEVSNNHAISTVIGQKIRELRKLNSKSLN